MKTLKKAITILIIACLITASLCTGVNAASRKQALPTSAGIQALRDEFEHGIAPETNGYALDYCYYSPAGKSDSEKYPLVIFLHGIGHADYEGSQLDDSDMPYWASAELQSRFTSGGAFILLPRAPEDELVYWNSSLIEPLRALIDDFIAKHRDNVDTTKIFITGSSAGGEMAWDMVISFPEYFAGAFPIASTGTVSASEVRKCSDVAIWMIASTEDPIVNYSLVTQPLWNNVKAYNSNPTNCRLSSLTNVVEPGGNSASDNHHLAKVITYDFHMIDGSTYPNVTTVDGNGNTVNLESPNGLIYWMNSVSSSYDGEPGTGTGKQTITFIDDILNFFRNYMLKVVNIFQRLLGL